MIAAERASEASSVEQANEWAVRASVDFIVILPIVW